jgi:DNA-binding SARP family transcriptional activator
MTAVLAVHLLGPFQVFDQQHPLTTFATDKVRALLVYLAMEADIPHRRESLATLIYPDSDDQQAISNLRKTLYRLRTALDQHTPTLSDTLLTISRATIQLNGSVLALDATQFRRTIANRLGKNRLTDDDLERLAATIALYRGEFAAGLSLADAQPFEEWLLLQRLSFHQQALYL